MRTPASPYFFKSYAQEHPGKWPTQEAPGDVTAKITGWVKDHPDIVKKWMEANPDAKEGPKDDDLVAFFYADYPNNPKNWPPFEAGEWVDADPAVKAVVKPDAADSDVESTFFDTWLTAQVQAKKLDPLKDFVQVPADMVTTSGSGLDPDISVANAVYQKDIRRSRPMPPSSPRTMSAGTKTRVSRTRPERKCPGRP